MNRRTHRPRLDQSARQRRLNMTRRIQCLTRKRGYDKRRAIRRARHDYMPAGLFMSVRRWSRDYGRRARDTKRREP